MSPRDESVRLWRVNKVQVMLMEQHILYPERDKRVKIAGRVELTVMR